MLLKALQSEEVRKYIEETYEGAVVPASKRKTPMGAHRSFYYYPLLYHDQNIPFITIIIPSIIKGIPIIAPTIVRVNKSPIIVIISPSNIAINFPVIFMTPSTILNANVKGNIIISLDPLNSFSKLTDFKELLLLLF